MSEKAPENIGDSDNNKKIDIFKLEPLKISDPFKKKETKKERNKRLYGEILDEFKDLWLEDTEAAREKIDNYKKLIAHLVKQGKNNIIKKIMDHLFEVAESETEIGNKIDSDKTDINKLNLSPELEELILNSFEISLTDDYSLLYNLFGTLGSEEGRKKFFEKAKEAYPPSSEEELKHPAYKFPLYKLLNYNQVEFALFFLSKDIGKEITKDTKSIEVWLEAFSSIPQELKFDNHWYYEHLIESGKIKEAVDLKNIAQLMAKTEGNMPIVSLYKLVPFPDLLEHSTPDPEQTLINLKDILKIKEEDILGKLSPSFKKRINFRWDIRDLEETIPIKIASLILEREINGEISQPQIEKFLRLESSDTEMNKKLLEIIKKELENPGNLSEFEKATYPKIIEYYVLSKKMNFIYKNHPILRTTIVTKKRTYLQEKKTTYIDAKRKLTEKLRRIQQIGKIKPPKTLTSRVQNRILKFLEEIASLKIDEQIKINILSYLDEIICNYFGFRYSRYKKIDDLNSELNKMLNFLQQTLDIILEIGARPRKYVKYLDEKGKSGKFEKKAKQCAREAVNFVNSKLKNEDFEITLNELMITFLSEGGTLVFDNQHGFDITQKEYSKDIDGYRHLGIDNLGKDMKEIRFVKKVTHKSLQKARTLTTRNERSITVTTLTDLTLQEAFYAVAAKLAQSKKEFAKDYKFLTGESISSLDHVTRFYWTTLYYNTTYSFTINKQRIGFDLLTKALDEKPKRKPEEKRYNPLPTTTEWFKKIPKMPDNPEKLAWLAPQNAAWRTASYALAMKEKPITVASSEPILKKKSLP